MKPDDLKNTVKRPPKPREPMPGECCGRGCVPCVYDYYEKALKRWHEKIALIESEQSEEKP